MLRAMSAPEVTPSRGSGWKAVLWTLICPGVGEFRLGHRALGATIAIVFVAVCGWLVVGTYGMVNDIAEYVKTADPSLNEPPGSGAEVAALVGRLTAAMHTEYQNRRAAINQRMWMPVWILCAMYFYSLVQSYVLGVRKDRAAAAAAPPPPPAAQSR